MKFNNTQLNNYVDRIKFTQEQKNALKPQVDYLISNIRSYISEHPISTSVQKVIQSGSWKKGTILCRSDDTELDIDLVFYLNKNKLQNENDIHGIVELIVEFLIAIYPNKSKKDFDEGRKTAHVEFRTSNLHVDIVPVIESDQYANYVKQPDTKTSEFYTTSIKNQLDFISKRKEENPSYTSIVRLLKKWKNFNDLCISSFAIELVVAYLDINKGVEQDIEEALLRTWLFLGSKKKPCVYFNPSIGTSSNYDLIYIADPTNKSNNVTKNITEIEWSKVQEVANLAIDRVIYAQEVGSEIKTINLWKEILGNSFNINP